MWSNPRSIPGLLMVGLCALASVATSGPGSDTGDVCEGAWLDATGVCHSADGGTADTRCCPDPCEGVTCGPDETCQLQQVQCVTAPCEPVPVCVDDGGNTDGLLCQSTAECSADEVCDTVNYCESPCGPDEICATVCYGRCVPGEVCGDTVCEVGMVCCNPLSGTCTEPGGFCAQ